MKFMKRFFLICLSIFAFLGVIHTVKAGGDDCMSGEMCPAGYYEYLATDPLGNALISNVPSSKKEEVREWMQTPWGKQTFKTVGGRNSNASSSLKTLSDLIYTKLREYYGIPKGLLNHFVISRGSSGVKLHLDSFGPSTSVSSMIKSKIHADSEGIFDWMLDCRYEKKLLPLEDYLK